MDMRLLILVPLFLAFFSLTGQSGLVLEAGLQSFINNNEGLITETQSHDGYHIGVVGRLGEQKIFFCPGFFYYNMPIEGQEGIKFFNDASKFHLFHIPAGFAYKFYFGESIGLRLELGINGNYFFIVDEHDQIGKDDINDFYFGAHGLIGFDFKAFVLDLKVHRGLTNAYYEVKDSKYNGLSLSAGFFF